MKLVLDFDDVLFNNAKLKEQIFISLEQRGVDRNISKDLYAKYRETGVPPVLKDFLRMVAEASNHQGLLGDGDCYEEIMSICSTLGNHELMKLALSVGSENVLIVTSGDREYQLDKIRRSLPEGLACEIIIVPGTKKEAIEELCARFKDEDVLFADDKLKFFNDIDMEKCPNLKTILFNENGLINLQAEMEASLEDEKARKNLRNETGNQMGGSFGMR